MTIPTGISSASSREYVLRTDNVYIYYNEVDNLKNNKTMKRIYLFVLTALMMLMSTSAMAQSETVKGDVNGDGVVDVADIAAVIKIMTDNGDIKKKYYWYVGQDEITADNYTTKATQVTSYPSTHNYTVEKRGYVYVLIANNKSITRIYDTSNNFDQAYNEVTSPIDGYKLYKTASAAAGTPLAMIIN